MSLPLLRVDNLKIGFENSAGKLLPAVDGVNFSINKGEIFALLGESGCGKSLTALAIMQLLPPTAFIMGQDSHIYFGDTDLIDLSEVELRQLRGRKIAMIFQEPMTSLNPVLTIEQQIAEVLKYHFNLSPALCRQRVLELLDAVKIPAAKKRRHEYPHQLSGGMKQRVMIAIALAAQPELLIADEPTTALDVTIQAQILQLLQELQQQRDMGVLLITHDLGLAHDFADDIGVMYAGHLIEQAKADTFFKEHTHPYSKKLFAALPNQQKRQQKLATIPGNVPPLTENFHYCRFLSRCDQAAAICHQQLPQWEMLALDHGVRCLRHNDLISISQPLENKEDTPITPTAIDLVVKDLKVHFSLKKGFFQRTVGYVKAVDGVNLHIAAGKTVALVGESGCGKTTVGKAILQLLKDVSGEVIFNQHSLTQLTAKALKPLRRDLQMIFQDPFSAMNPRMMVRNIISEGMKALKVTEKGWRREIYLRRLLQDVGLPKDSLDRYPHEFSGGQRQRIAIARALAVKPKLIICDEPTSALDVSVQAQILNLLKNLQQRFGLAYLFITHNISVVAYLADEVAVMYLGRIVEYGTVDEVLNTPKHPYTQALLSAVPSLTHDEQHFLQAIEGEQPSPISPPPGCYFHPRCPKAMPECKINYPDVTEISSTQKVHCYLY